MRDSGNHEQRHVGKDWGKSPYIVSHLEANNALESDSPDMLTSILVLLVIRSLAPVFQNLGDDFWERL